MARIYLLTAFLGIIPVSELRGAIPYAYFNGVPMWLSFVLGVFSNALVPFLGFLFFYTFHRIFDRWPFYHRLFEKTVERARKKVGDKVRKYGLLGLMLFVAIPLPITGAWTGTLGAWVLGLDKKKSILYILLGILFAGMIVTTVVQTGAGIASLFTKEVNI